MEGLEWDGSGSVEGLRAVTEVSVRVRRVGTSRARATRDEVVRVKD